MHGKDATYVAEAFFKTQDAVKMLGDNGVEIPTVNVNHKKMARIIKEVVLREYRDVEVYHKDNGEWKIKKKVCSLPSTHSYTEFLSHSTLFSLNLSLTDKF